MTPAPRCGGRENSCSSRLVLHDAGMDARSPTHELVRAHAFLLARRRIAVQPPNWALTASGPSVLRGSKSIGDACGNENTDVPPACKCRSEDKLNRVNRL